MEKEKVLEALNCENEQELEEVFHSVVLEEMEEDNCITSSILKELDKSFEADSDQNCFTESENEEEEEEEWSDASDQLWGSNENIVSILEKILFWFQ